MLGYFQQSKRCQLAGLPKNVVEPLNADEDPDEPPKELPPCLSFRMRDDDLDVLARTRAVVPAIHGLFTFFTAMKNAWKLKCRNRCVRGSSWLAVFGPSLVREEKDGKEAAGEEASRSPPFLLAGFALLSCR